MTVRSRGPSSSQKKIPCHFPSASLPPSTGTSTCGPRSDARTCEGAFGPSGSSTCCQRHSSWTICSSAASRSRATAGSAASLIVTPAVVCGTYTSAAPAPSAPSRASATRRVMSTSCVRRSVRTVRMRTAVILRAVPSQPLSEARLEQLRTGADRFMAELDEEYYLHFAGHKETLDLEPIFARHAELATPETAQELGAGVDGDRRRRELWRFSSEGYLGNLTREHAEREAALEAELVADFEGDEIPFRMLRPTIANEPDRDRRGRLDEIRTSLTEEHLNPIHLDAARTVTNGVRKLGASSYLELYRDRFKMDLEGLAEQCRAFLEDTERLWEDAGDRLFRERAGVPLAEAKRWDTARVFRAPIWDDQFPADRMLPALEATLADLGIDLKSQENVHLDVEQRPLKSPRAFCSPIEVPDRVMLVIQPMGGPDDWRALFHEAGHTEHFAHTSRNLSVEERRLGDNAVTEGWAMLLQHLTDEPGWLNRRLDFPRADEFAAEGAAGLLFFVRRYCAKLLYELEFHAADDPTTMSSRYVELLGDALKVEPSAIDYLGDIDSGFYVSSYLRSWAFESQLRDFLREEFGSDWFARREAGSLLRELWELGQRPTAEELLKDVTGQTLEMASVGDRIREFV